MVTANELLNRLSVSNSENEGHIVIGIDRKVTVPESLKRIAVQFDHNVETVTFDCPRYWDGLDMSNMAVYINYMRSDKFADSYPVGTVTVDDVDPNIMHFDWTISRNVTSVDGGIVFLVCVKNTDEEGLEVNHWNSELCKDLTVSPGMEADEQFMNNQYDLVTQLLLEVASLREEVENIEITGGGSINVDQTYNPTSQNAQSGKAVEEAFGSSFDYVGTSANILPPTSEVGYYNTSLEKLNSSTMRRTPDPVEVIGGKYLYTTCNFETTNDKDKLYLFFIDADGVYIKHSGYTPAQTALGSIGVPSNAVSFVAYCSDASGLGIDMSNFCLSYTAKTYEEFVSKRILKEDATNIKIIDKRIDEKLSTASGTSTSNKLLGKTLVCFGDSLIGNYNPPTDIPTYVANLTGMTVYNQGYGGSRAVSHNTVYDPFSFYRLVDAIVSGDFSTQEAQLNNGVPAYYATRIAQLKTIDFNNVDFVIFNHGTNDWCNTGLPLDEGGIEKPATSFGVAIRYCIDKLLTAYPHLKILPVTPIWRARKLDGDGLETDTNPNTADIYLWQYAEKTMEVAKEFHLPSLDAYYTTGINTKNAHIYLEDGLHLNETGRELLANKIAQKILLEYC